MTFSELLGDKILQHGESGNESIEISTDQLNGKTVALYFSLVYSYFIDDYASPFSFFLELIGVHHAEILHQSWPNDTKDLVMK